MDKYVLLQMKRVLRMLPFALVTAILLIFGVTIALHGFSQVHASNQGKLQVAVVGDPEDSFLQMGITAVQSFDSSRFTVEIHSMTEEEAVHALEQGEIGAYVMIPAGFSQAALQGKVVPLELVSAPNSVGLVKLFKEEITEVISQIVISCQKGMGGIEDTLTAVQQSDEIGSYMQSVSKNYVELLLVRSEAYHIEEITGHGNLSLLDDLLCGFCVLLFAFMTIPFAPLYIKKDLALEQILIGKSYSVMTQVLSEFVAYVCGILLSVFFALILCAMGCRLLDASEQTWIDSVTWQSFAFIIPVFLLLVAFSYMLCSLGKNLMSGMLLNCFCTMVFCFAGGCLYPRYFFPASMQKITQYLPHSLARDYMGSSVSGDASTLTVLGVIGYTILFLLVAGFVRHYRITKKEG